MDRRTFIAGTAAAAGLATQGAAAPNYDSAIAREKPLPEAFAPKIVRIAKGMGPNEMHVVPDHYSLYWTLPDQQAIRYYVGVGRDGIYHNGTFVVGAKKEWPEWTPTAEMIKRDPASYKKFEEGVPGGPTNPLGARAIYLYYPGRGDSYLRIHGTNLPHTIGRDVSNGCARLVNAQVVDLYNRVPIGAKVILHRKGLLEKKPIWKVKES